MTNCVLDCLVLFLFTFLAVFTQNKPVVGHDKECKFIKNITIVSTKEIDIQVNSGNSSIHLDKSVDNKAVGSPKLSIPRRVSFTENKKKYRAMRTFGVMFTILLLLTAIGYLLVSVLASFDSHGREVYFTDNPANVYRFEEAKEIKEANPERVMRTDNWGYFYKANQRSNESYWSNYNIIPHIWITAGVTTFLWLLVCIMDIYKYALLAWRFAIPTFLLSLITIILNIVGSIIIGLKIYKFRSDNSDFWDICNCQEFKNRFRISRCMMFFATIAVLGLAIIHLILEIVFWVKKPKA